MMRPLLKYFALFAVLGLFSFPVAEGVFRLLGDKTTADLGGLYAAFEDGSYKLATSVDTGAYWSAGRFSVHTDTLGLRSDEARRFAARPGDHLDVLLLGDSQGFGNGVSYEDSLAGGISELGAQHGYRISNASVGGHALLNQLRLMQWLRDHMKVTTGNYTLLMTPVMVSNAKSFARAAVGEDGRLYQRPLSPIGRIVSWLKTHAVTYARIRDAVRNYGVGTKPDAAGAMVFQIYGTSNATERVESELLTTMKEIKDFAAQQGAGIQIVYVPLTIEIDSANLKKAGAARGVILNLETPFRICSAVASRLEIPMIDLRPVVQALHDEGRPLNLRADFHYNSELSRRSVASIWPQLQPLFKKNQNATTTTNE